MNIPTAEEFLDIKFPNYEDLDNGNIWVNIEETMIEFAKLHVNAALKTVHRNFQAPEEDLEFTINSYPLENIK